MTMMVNPNHSIRSGFHPQIDNKFKINVGNVMGVDSTE